MGNIQENIEIICFVFLIVVIVFGTIGNIVSLIIWSRGPKSKSLVCSTYFKLVSITDICVLLIPGIYEVLRLYPVKYVLTGYNNFLCKSVTFGRLFATQISTWLIVTVTVERTVSTLFPLKYHLDKARKRAYVAGCVICVLAFLSNSVFLYGMEITAYNVSAIYDFYALMGKTTSIRKLAVQNNAGLDIADDNVSGLQNTTQNDTGTDQIQVTATSVMINGSSRWIDGPILNEGRYCDFVNLPRIVESIVWTVNYVVLVCVMPLSIILLCNIAILVRLCYTHTPRNSTSQTRNSLAMFTRLVLAIGVCFTLSTLPMALYVLRHLNTTYGALDLPELDILPIIARSLSCLNNGTNFILYFLSGGNFREDFKIMIKSVFKCSKHTRRKFDLGNDTN